MGSDLDAARKYLLSLAQQVDKWHIDDPNDWRPYEVVNPVGGQTFTHESARELIVQLLEAGQDIRPVTQRKPPGVIAYEMIHQLSDGSSVYIKIRAGKRGHIFGRSFHYEEG